MRCNRSTRAGIGSVHWVAILTAAATLWASRANAQNGAEESWAGVVTAESLSVRCARSHQYYEIARLRQGDIVEVREVNQFDWATIAAPRGVKGVVRVVDMEVAADGSKATTLGPVRVYYLPLDDEIDPWKGTTIPDGVSLRITDRRTTTHGESLVVEMPNSVNAYAPAEFIRRATAEEIEAFRNRRTDERETTPEVEAAEDPETTPNQPEAEAEAEEPTDDSVSADAEETTGDGEVGAVDDTDTPEAHPEDELDETVSDEMTDQPMDETTGELPSGDDLEIAEDESEPVSTPALPRMSIEKLEALFERDRRASLDEIELEPIIAGYREIAADESASDQVRRLAELRIEWLDLRLEAQQARRRLAESLSRAQRSADEVAREAQIDLKAGDYVVTGRLVASHLYDGSDLPRLYRVIDPLTNHTRAYLIESREVTASGHLGDFVGVRGEVNQDPALGGVLVVRPVSIESIPEPTNR
ncbi:MAG: hypothetical protein ACF8PN_15015 [Phycisphaerales bacterium]